MRRTGVFVATCPRLHRVPHEAELGDIGHGRRFAKCGWLSETQFQSTHCWLGLFFSIYVISLTPNYGRLVKPLNTLMVTVRLERDGPSHKSDGGTERSSGMHPRGREIRHPLRTASRSRRHVIR